MRPGPASPRASDQPMPPGTPRPQLERTPARYSRARPEPGAAPVRFKPAPAGQRFTPRQFRPQPIIDDSGLGPIEGEESSYALHLQNEPSAQPGRPPALGQDAFGIPRRELDAARKDIEPQFQRFYLRAQKREESKSGKSSYVEKTRTVKTADGSAWEEKVWERREEKRSVKLQAWQAEKGRNIQTGLNKVDRIVRDKTGRPRKTGSNYATDKAKDDLLTPGKQTLNDNLAGTLAVAVALNQGPTNYAAHEDPGLAADLNFMADGVAGAAVAPAIVDGYSVRLRS
jgi:hypothetical protein